VVDWHIPEPGTETFQLGGDHGRTALEFSVEYRGERPHSPSLSRMKKDTHVEQLILMPCPDEGNEVVIPYIRTEECEQLASCSEEHTRPSAPAGWHRVASGGIGWHRVASGGIGWHRVASGGIGCRLRPGAQNRLLVTSNLARAAGNRLALQRANLTQLHHGPFDRGHGHSKAASGFSPCLSHGLTRSHRSHQAFFQVGRIGTHAALSCISRACLCLSQSALNVL
jgi:hypothetical protein